jgi:hypothetical protein
MDVLFGGANHIEKGGDLMHVEDVHHAHLGSDNIAEENRDPVDDKATAVASDRSVTNVKE